ncbi:MAG: hypothetical protein KKF62_01700, partial [Bacteroidetes bacterium]|nr:hypothetical protein [Bacteroidota bacterium]
IYIIILFLPILSIAQISSDSLSFVKSRYSTPMLTSNFEKQLQTFNLKEDFIYGKQIDNLFIGITQTFISTIIKSNAISVRDNAFFSLLGQYDFSNNLSFGSNVNYNIYSDDKQLAINNSSVFNTSAYLKYYPMQKMSFTPFLGISRNEQIGIIDNGPLYGIEAILDNYNFNDFNLFSGFKFQTEDIAPRKNQIINFRFDIDKTFENDYHNKLLGLYSEQRKDFYFNTDSLTMNEFNISKNIQSRMEKRYSFIDRLRMITSLPGLILDIDGSLDWRTIDRDTRYISTENISSSSFDTKVEEFKINFISSLLYNSNWFNGVLRISFSDREEKHRAKFINGAKEIFYEKRDEQEKRKNNNSKQITLSGEGTYSLSSFDRISMSIFHRKLMYDTPSELNYDDRDELLSMFEIRYFRNMSPFLNLFTGLQGSINQTVYLFKERSANNNILRVLKLIAGGDIHMKNLTSKTSAEVSANYTVYDFQHLNPNLKSFSYRQLSLRDSTTLKLFRSTYFRFLGYVKFSEQGDFDWEGFSNNPVRYLDERYAEPTIEFRFKYLSFAFGIRYFSLFTYLYDNNIKTINSTYTSTAPLSEIVYSISNTLNLSIRGWYEFINTELNQNNELANLTIRLNWNF